jgi:predicted DNA-binding protein (UPF0251 family)
MKESASRMGVSSHALGRILANERRAAADALVNGRALRIEGGDDEAKPSAVSDGQIEET